MKNKLIELAAKYETPDFVKDDPVFFPKQYTDKRDIEISAFVTSWIAYGNRKAIMKKAKQIDEEIFKGKPYEYIKSLEWQKYYCVDESFYRFYKYGDFYDICTALYCTYGINEGEDLEFPLKRSIMAYKIPIIDVIKDYFSEVKGIPQSENSPCKRLNLFLRWMVRKDSPVDIGIWNVIEPEDLIIPLDTHVHKQALEMGITKRKTADMKTAIEITNYFKTIFPNDPCKGDFALFGYGINNK